LHFINFTDFSNFFSSNIFNKLIFYFTNVYFNVLIFVIVFFLLRLILKSLVFFFKIKLAFMFIFVFFFSFFEIQYFENNIFIFDRLPFLNKTLQNGILLFHPFITYVVYVVIFFRKKIMNHTVYGFFYLLSGVFTIKFDLMLSLTSLILGSVWASQEIGWGGFWNWDPIELILVFFCITVIIYLHEIFQPIRLVEILYLMNFLTLYLLIFLFMVRLDLFKSIHTFVIFTDSMKLNFSFFLTSLFVVLIVWNYSFSYGVDYFGFYNKFFLKGKRSQSIGSLYLYLFYTIVLYLILNSSITDWFIYEFEVVYNFLVKFIFYLIFCIFFNKLIFFKKFYYVFDLKLNLFFSTMFAFLFFYFLYLYVFTWLLYVIFIKIYSNLKIYKGGSTLVRFNCNVVIHNFVFLFFFFNLSRDGFIDDFCDFIKISGGFLMNEIFYLNDFFTFKYESLSEFFNFYRNDIYDFDSLSVFEKNFYTNDSVVFIFLKNVTSNISFFIEDTFYIFLSTKLYHFSVLISYLLYTVISTLSSRGSVFFF